MQPIYKRYIATVTIIWAVCFILLIMAYLFILVPQDKVIAQKAQDLAAKDLELKHAIDADSEESRAKLASQLSGLCQSAGNYALSIDAASKLAFDVGQIAAELQVADFACSVNSQEMVSSMTDCNSIGMMALTVNYKSSFNKFAMFVNRLERNRPAIFVDRFSIDNRTSDGDLHQVTMLIKVFVSKVPFVSETPGVKVAARGVSK